MGGKDSSSYRFPFASYPALRIVLLLSSGIVLGAILAIEFRLSAICALVLLILWLFFEFILNRTHKAAISHTSAILYCLLIVAAGFFLYTIQMKSKESVQETEKILSLFEGEDLRMEGKVLKIGTSASGGTVLVFESHQTHFLNGKSWYRKYLVRAYSDAGPDDAVPGLRAIITFRPYSFPKRRNPHEFDYGRWLRNEGFSVHGGVESFQTQELTNSGGWSRIRNRVISSIERQFSKPTVPLAKALFLGIKEDLNPEIKALFSRSGLSHVMAVSGLHVGFVVAPFWLIIPFLWGNRYGKWAGLLILTFLLMGYAGLTGFTASVCRASLMAWLLTAAKLFHKMSNSINLTASAGLVLLLIDPSQLFDPGFQLSFSAVFVILLVMPEVLRWLPAGLRFGRA
ncbi:MAG: ComEC/Rec2 family competence protein, partial [Balneolaceae bacterium]|nr:ComEC/Rec2 family competence protein [Balneolaceae bacterium]